MPLGMMFAIQCNWLRWSNLDPTADLTSPCVCSATKMLNIKHHYHLHLFDMTGDCPGDSPTSYILLSRRKLIFIYIIVISRKIHMKSTFKWCLYVNSSKLWRLVNKAYSAGSLSGPMSHTSMQPPAWSVMSETATRQLWQAHSPDAQRLI